MELPDSLHYAGDTAQEIIEILACVKGTSIDRVAIGRQFVINQIELTGNWIVDDVACSINQMLINLSNSKSASDGSFRSKRCVL